MKCPNCGTDQPDGSLECMKCGTILLTDDTGMNVGPAPGEQLSGDISDVPAAHGAEMSFAPASEPPSILKLAGIVAALFVVAVGIFWLFSPGGGDVPDDAVVQEEQGYAISAPNGWTLLRKDNYDALVKELGPRLPDNIKNEIKQGRIDLGVIKLLPPPEFSPSVNVVIVKDELPTFDDAEKEKAIKALTAVYKMFLKDFTVLKNELVEVDELTSLKVSMAGTMTLKPGSSPQGFGDVLRLRITQTMVPGNKRAYILTATSLETQESQYERTFNLITDSFRVTDRPPVFGTLITNALRVALLAAAAYLLYALVAGIVALLRR